MSEGRVVFLRPLSRFVLEVLPWALSGLIGLYLLWGFCSGSDGGRAGLRHVAKPVAAPSAGAAASFVSGT